MDRKSLIILSVCFVLLFTLKPITDKFFPPIKVEVPLTTNQLGQVTASNSGIITNPAPSAIAGSTTPANAPVAHKMPRPSAPESILTRTNGRAVYTFSSHSGGIKNVALLDYPENIRSKHKTAKTGDWVTLNESGDGPVLAVLGDESIEGDGVFSLSDTKDGVIAEKSLANGLVLTKQFQFASNFVVNASIKFANQGNQSIILPSREILLGTIGPMNTSDIGLGETVLWYNGSKTTGPDLLGYFATNTSSFMGFVPRVPKVNYMAGNGDVNWVSAQNQYFIIGAMPEKPAQGVSVNLIHLPPPTVDELVENPSAVRTPKGMKTMLYYASEKLEPGHSITNSYHLFIGPKKYQTIALIAAQFNNDFDLVMNFGWLAPVSKSLLLAMNWMNSATGMAYGLLIILLTVMLRAVFWPITAATTRSSKRMQALQPQIKALQDKYKDDPQKLTAKQWEFYKENNINPLSGCLPMLVQIPVFFGFYFMLRTAIELRGQHFLWMLDLSKPDTIFNLPIPLSFLGAGDIHFPINLMPILSGLTQVWQASLMPTNASMDASQQKMMRYMPLIALFFMYGQPAGLALYWTTSNLLAILQTKLTKTGDLKPVVSAQRKKK